MSAYDKNTIEIQYQECAREREEILADLKEHIIAVNEPLEGNSFYYHDSLNLHPDLYTKQLNLFWAGQQAETKICEIGFNAGHSSMLFLLGRPKTPLSFTVFDIGLHRYVRPCLQYIKERFTHVNFEYVEGDSIETIPKWLKEHPAEEGTFDVVHMDGGHLEPYVASDFKNCDRLVKKGGILIVDDTNSTIITRYLEKYLKTGNYEEVSILATAGYPHRILRRIK